MIQFIFILSLALALLTTILAIKGNKKWYWLAGLCMYIFSFLSSWSIGGYTLSLAFALWTLAIGYSLKRIKKLYQSAIAVIIGLIVWRAMITTLDDVWWYLPFSIFTWLTSK